MYIKKSDIRKAEAADVSMLNFLIQHCFSDVAQRFNLTAENFPVYPLSSTVEKVQEDFLEGIFFLIKIDRGIPSGYIGIGNISDKIFKIHHMGVLPGRRRRGFGRSLMERAILAAKDQKAEYVKSTIISADTELKQWYEKFGFCKIQTKQENQCPHQVTLMQLSLL